ncbi:Rubredoxin-type Fe(Cys)4 protein [Methanoregula boonei 6A8]|uniref:Rubredoxin n=1 Tax=Methanoregula boonei (strain DSM 21154 / JCM 14090 / 6A8) TaxID=456442 RepID=A7I518_METB6|nr:rubredoxin [Methanoregula boonei]ABS54829.1 Rubredoxin-type Fe(Cys)4 protein [Methanoregula boonei 6A8]
MQSYVCQACGHKYVPKKGDAAGNIPAGTSFEALPTDWTCPACFAGRDEFWPV